MCQKKKKKKNVFVVLPSLPPFWLDFEMLRMCLLFLFCYILDAVLCYVWKKYKNVDNKKKKKKKKKKNIHGRISQLKKICINIKITCVKCIIELRFKAFMLHARCFETVCLCGIKIANRLVKQVY